MKAVAAIRRLKMSYNSLENPIGIETSNIQQNDTVMLRYNSLENPIGIETLVPLPDLRQGELQLIRKPDRD